MRKTKTFQAIRIFVNQEISELIEGIIKATKILKPGGKLIVISFHSIEDKIVKFYFKNFSKIIPEQINIYQKKMKNILYLNLIKIRQLKPRHQKSKKKP